MADEPLFLGIDGGATRCRARVETPSGATAGEGEAGSANPRHGPDDARAAILAATGQALAAAGLGGEAMGRLHAGLGLAGVGQAADRRLFLAWAHPFRSLTLATDAEVACLGAHGGGDGAVIVVGTGSCGVAMVAGRTTRIGGWGFPVSDHAGGAWIGLSAVRRALLAHDGVIRRSRLTRAVMARFADDPEQVVAWQSTAKPADYGTLAPLVFDHARDRDREAVRIVRTAAGDVDRMAIRLSKAGTIRLSLLGGLAGPLRPWLSEGLVALLHEPVGTPLDGALALARQGATTGET